MTDAASFLLWLALAAAAGALLAGLAAAAAARARGAAALARAEAAAQAELATLRERVRALEAERQALAGRQDGLQAQAGRWRDELDAVRDDRAALQARAQRLDDTEAALAASRHDAGHWRTQAAELATRLDAERAQADEKLALLTQARQALSDQFRQLAGEILEEKGKRLAEQHDAQLGQLLDPLKLRLTEFQAKVEDVYVKEGKDRSALAEQVRQLMALNQTLSEDAKGLTRALRGSSKAQGHWGELVLERVLEASGLRKGEEYEVQASFTRDDATRAQPDVIVRLPEGRSLVIDAKVSLVAYEDCCGLEDEAERLVATRRHLESVRGHFKGLADRNYQSLYGLKSLDFVLMFVPVEPAFMLAVAHDRELFMDAWGRNVLLVSPSTLLFVVRTVAHLWRQEAQSRNAQDIARRGAELYDKLVGFVADLEAVGERLSQAQASFIKARDKLSLGPGNVIRRAEMLKALGIKPTKDLPAALVEAAVEDALADEARVQPGTPSS